MSNEWDRRGNVDGGGRGGSTVSRGSKPGGGTLAGNRYAGISPPQSDSTAAAPVQRKNLFASLPGLQENQPVRDDDPLDFTTLYSSQLGATAVTTPIQRRQSLEPATDPVHDRGPMLNLVTSVVQRRTTTSAMDAPRADSLREDRATIGAAPAAAASEQRAEVDASKADSLSEDRATIAPDAESAPGPLAPERAARAAAKNPALVARHGISAAELGTEAAPDSAAFAQAVAGFQTQHGLAVDGIVGPKTAAAVRGGGAAPAGETASGGSAPAADPGASADIDARGAGSSLLQMRAAPGVGSEEDVHRAANDGIASGGQSLPHLERIQTAFGAHDVSGIQAHVGGAAASASEAIGAEAYATGNHVAFKQSPDLHTAAHEAAHVVQQRGGVQLKGGVGQAGDSYEQHADAVADKVVRGDSAEAELDHFAGGTARSAVQRKDAGYSRGDNKKLVRLALQQAAATAKAGAAEPSAVACYQVSSSLRHAVASVDVPQDKSVALRDLFGPSDLAYLRAAELHAAASEALGDEEPAVVGLLASMHELSDLLAPAGWRRPANARAAQARGARARRNGNKESFGTGDRASLVSKSLMTASHFIQNLVGSGKPITPAAFAVTTAEAHRQIEFSYDQMLDGGKELVSIRDVIERTTGDVSSLERQALVLAKRPEDLADTVNLANQIRARVGLAPLPRAELTADEFGRKLAATETLINASYERLEGLLWATALAYHGAWKRHTDALKSAAQQRLRGSLVQQAVVAAIAGGLGGFAAQAMKVKLGLDTNGAWQAVLADGVKDVYKLIAKQNLKVPNVDALAIFPPDSFEWIARAKVELAKERMIAYNAFLVWQTAFANNDARLERTFDPFAEFQAHLAVRGEPISELPAVDEGAAAVEFEKGFWKVWLQNYAHTVQTSGMTGTDMLNSYSVRKHTDDNIIKAIDDLGEDGAAWVKTYGGVAKERATQEADDLTNHITRA